MKRWLNRWAGAGMVALACCGAAAQAQDTVPSILQEPTGAAATPPRDENNTVVEGACKMSFEVDAKGMPKHLQVVACTDERLSAYARGYVTGEVFQPATRKGKNVSMKLMTNVVVRAKSNAADADKRADEKKSDAPATVGGGVSAPKILYGPDAPFPQSLKDSKKSCMVQIDLIVDRYGVPQSERVTKPCDSEADASAVRTVSSYLFKPAMMNGRPVAVRVVIEVGFSVY